MKRICFDKILTTEDKAESLDIRVQGWHEFINPVEGESKFTADLVCAWHKPTGQILLNWLSENELKDKVNYQVFLDWVDESNRQIEQQYVRQDMPG